MRKAFVLFVLCALLATLSPVSIPANAQSVPCGYVITVTCTMTFSRLPTLVQKPPKIVCDYANPRIEYICAPGQPPSLIQYEYIPVFVLSKPKKR